MKQIDKKLPIYKQAWILVENYKEIGIRCVYNDRNRNVYLSLLNAPVFVENVSGAQTTLVGVFKPFSRVRDNFQYFADKYKTMYKMVYANNPGMLKYLERREFNDECETRSEITKIELEQNKSVLNKKEGIYDIKY